MNNSGTKQVNNSGLKQNDVCHFGETQFRTVGGGLPPRVNNYNFIKYVDNYMRRVYSSEYILLILKFIYELRQITLDKYILEINTATGSCNSKEIKLSRYQIACYLSKMFNGLGSNSDNEYLVQDFNYICNELKNN